MSLLCAERAMPTCLRVQSLVVWRARPRRGCAELLQAHVDKLFSPVDIPRCALKVDVVPFPPKLFGWRIRYRNCAPRALTQALVETQAEVKNKKIGQLLHSQKGGARTAAVLLRGT